MSWADNAECRGEDPELFFPEAEGKERPEVRAAIKICRNCTVAQECFDEVLHIDPRDDFGIRAGLTARERRAMRRSLGARSA